MKLEYAKRISNEFADIFWPLKNQLNIDSIILYGSIIKNKPFPKDIDLMIVHTNQVLDSFVKVSKNKKIKDLEKLIILQEILQFELFEKLSQTETMKILEKDLLNVNYLNKKFFTNEEYRISWNKENKIYHKKSSPNFIQEILDTGAIWDGKIKSYSINPKTKYSIE